MTGLYLQKSRKRGFLRIGAQAATGLLLLCCAIPLSSCSGEAKQPPDFGVIPAGLLVSRLPVYADPANATQADAADALAEADDAARECHANLEGVKSIVVGLQQP